MSPLSARSQRLASSPTEANGRSPSPSLFFFVNSVRPDDHDGATTKESPVVEGCRADGDEENRLGSK